MKTKKIEYIINKKFQTWVDTITDPNVKSAVEKNTILTGGAICSMFLNEQINDFDFYFRDIQTTELVAQYYVNLFKSKHHPHHSNGMPINIGVIKTEDRVAIKIQSAGAASSTSSNEYEYFELCSDNTPSQEYVSDLAHTFATTKKENVFLPIFMSSNAITLSDDIQLIIRFFGDPKTIHENYDFVHCTNYWESNVRKVITNTNALECILGKELKYIGSKYPIASLFRTRKFIKRGWNITAGQMLKIAMQVSELNLKDFSILNEQLIGVDVAYFHEIIQKLKEANPNSIDTSYLIQLIDEIF